MTTTFDEPERRIRVAIIADDFELRNRYLRDLYSQDFDVVGDTGDLETAIDIARSRNPDAVLVNLRPATTPGGPGDASRWLGLARSLQRENHRVGIIFLWDSGDTDATFVALRTFGRWTHPVGFFHKEEVCTPQDLGDAIRRTLTDGRRTDAEAYVPLPMGIDSRVRREHLTPTKRRILNLFVQGHSFPEVAHSESISHRTLESHLGARFG